MNTSRTIKVALTAAAAVASIGLAGGTASAAHCTDAGGPGHSDYAQNHVRAQAGNNGHHEGQHKGWSTCEENSTNYAP